jgi:hypothetical protein
MAVVSLGHLPLNPDIAHSSLGLVLLLGLSLLLALSGLAPLFFYEGTAALEYDLVRALLGGGAAAGLLAVFQLPISGAMFRSAPTPVVIGFGLAVLFCLSGLLPLLGTLLRPAKRSSTGEPFLAQRVSSTSGVDMSWGQPVALAEYHVEDTGRTTLGPSLRPNRWFAEGPLPPKSAGDWPQHVPNESPWGPKRPSRP